MRTHCICRRRGHKEIENSICDFSARKSKKRRGKKETIVDQISWRHMRHRPCSASLHIQYTFCSHRSHSLTLTQARSHRPSATPRWKGEKSFLSSECKAKPYCSFSVIILYFFFQKNLFPNLSHSHSRSHTRPLVARSPVSHLLLGRLPFLRRPARHPAYTMVFVYVSCHCNAKSRAIFNLPNKTNHFFRIYGSLWNFFSLFSFDERNLISFDGDKQVENVPLSVCYDD